MLYEVLRRRKDLEAWTATELESSVRFANAIGALVTTRKGGIPAMPSLQEVEGFLANYPK
jgi:fructokinase